MNNIILKGTIKNIQFSHKINNTEYYKANIITKRLSGKEDIIDLSFKKVSNILYKEDDQVSLVGNLRSFSQRDKSTGKNHVNIYAFTYFDIPDDNEIDCEVNKSIVNLNKNNLVHIDGNICKIEDIHILPNGKRNLHFIIANNIISKSGKKINSYIPCVAWGETATFISENCKINSKVDLTGEFHSRTYRKNLENGEFVFEVAHELYIMNISADSVTNS